MNTMHISIIGMHCSGCKNLITLALQEEGFTDVVVDERAGTAWFSTDQDTEQVRTRLDHAFKDMPDYTYTLNSDQPNI